MIKSMTAFAGIEHSRDNITVTVEMRGYNSRYLDLAVKLPSSYGWVEDRVKQAVGRCISRGRVEVRIQIRTDEQTCWHFAVNPDLADAYYAALDELKNRFGLTEPIGISDLTGVSGIVETVENQADADILCQVMDEAMQKALEAFEAMRIDEGQAMARDLETRLSFIENGIERIDNLRQGLVEACHQRIETRIRELTGDQLELDPARIAQEAAMLADKSDISEELTRTESHVRQFWQIMEAAAPAGKPLNFLLQELNREVNTMGVKAGSADISHIVVSVKTELEKLREQVQNIE
ncbi:MAG: YicC family protein [Desulfobacterales bacterium]|nr:YicC family protein [Desulfobacterales bacterium]